MIKKYFDFVNEAKKAPGEKKEKATELVAEIIKMLNACPTVEMTNDWPNEKHAYTLAGIKKYMKTKGFTTTEVDDAMTKIANDKTNDVKNVKVEVAKYNEEYPYYFIEKDMDKYAIVEYYEGLQKDLKDKMSAKKAEIAKAHAGKKKDAEVAKIEKKAKAVTKKAAPKKEGEEKKAPAKKAAAKTTRKK